MYPQPPPFQIFKYTTGLRYRRYDCAWTLRLHSMTQWIFAQSARRWDGCE